MKLGLALSGGGVKEATEYKQKRKRKDFLIPVVNPTVDVGDGEKKVFENH